MPLSIQIAHVASIISFTYYGTSCLISKKMLLEFERYKLERYQKLVGSLQLLGAFGLFCGFYHELIGKFAALGLTLQMVLAVIVRIKIKDGFLQTIPAILFFLTNFLILIS